MQVSLRPGLLTIRINSGSCYQPLFFFFSEDLKDLKARQNFVFYQFMLRPDFTVNTVCKFILYKFANGVSTLNATNISFSPTLD